jgi:hypothetical protein
MIVVKLLIGCMLAILKRGLCLWLVSISHCPLIVLEKSNDFGEMISSADEDESVIYLVISWSHYISRRGTG